MTYKDHPDDLKLVNWLSARALEILDAAGAEKKWAHPVNEQQFAVHLLGTCRMGSEPKTSVINTDHCTHDIKNLFLCDGSSLVSSGRGQPTMTFKRWLTAPRIVSALSSDVATLVLEPFLPQCLWSGLGVQWS